MAVVYNVPVNKSTISIEIGVANENITKATRSLPRTNSILVLSLLHFGHINALSFPIFFYHVLP